jgi:chemotaxis protein MotB
VQSCGETMAVSNEASTNGDEPVEEGNEAPKVFVFDEGPPAPPEEEEPAGAPLWVVTFADLMSLLMCFFVMLLSMSQLDVEKFKAMAEGMSKGLGAKPSVKLKDISIDDILSQADKIKAKMRQQTLNDADKLKELLAPEIMDRKVELEIIDQLITVRILQSGSFSAGSADLKRAFLPVAKRIRSSLAEIRGSITVSGHTDNQPMSGGRFRSNWELSGSRAFSVIHQLLKDGQLPPNRFVLTGHAETRPLSENDSSEGRARNRRVEVVIDQRDIRLFTDKEKPDETLKKDTESLKEVLRREIDDKTVEVEKSRD